MERFFVKFKELEIDKIRFKPNQIKIARKSFPLRIA